MPKSTEESRRSTVKRRNPVARALRDAAYRARKEANRRRYSRKSKHKPTPATEPD